MSEVSPLPRRDFVKRTAFALGGMLSAPVLLRSQSQPVPNASSPVPPLRPVQGDARAYWMRMAEKIAKPVLENLAARTLKKNMPFELKRPGDAKDRIRFTHLEAIGRLLCGFTSWLEQDKPARWLELTREAIDAATDPGSPDFMNFKTPSQPLVDTAFFAQGLMRAPKTLWEPLEERVKKNVITAFKEARKIKPFNNNWLLFAAELEAFFHTIGEPVDRSRVDNALKKHMEWYKGDGVYGDGPNFHWDYYNSYVIQPMLLDVTRVFEKDAEWGKLGPTVLRRAQRYADIQERLIAPDGTYPIFGRSNGYRCGAFQTLAQIALLKRLPKETTPEQVRCALTAVIRRQLEAPGTFDDQGWLRLGFCGHQPSLADRYVSTGSLYLCSPVFLPLGLPAEDPFWSGPDAPWTAVKAWSGVDLPADHAING